MAFHDNSLHIAANSKEKTSIIKKLTALWAFNEAVLGGMLHGLHIPLTGILVGGFAVVLISLIAYFSENKKEIAKASAIVITAKFILSPHTPLNAYVSVLFQSAAALLFFGKKKFKISAILFGTVTLAFSAVQRIIVYTLLFGVTLWDSIDGFYLFVLREFNLQNGTLARLSISEIIMGGYFVVHLAAGLLIGAFAGNFPEKLLEQSRAYNNQKTRRRTIGENGFDSPSKETRKTKAPMKKLAIKFFALFSFTILILTYIYPEKFDVTHNQIIIMIFRFAAIAISWRFLAAPLLMKKLETYAKQTENKYSNELGAVVSEISQIKELVIESWRISKKTKITKRAQLFALSLFTKFLFE